MNLESYFTEDSIKSINADRKEKKSQIVEVIHEAREPLSINGIAASTSLDPSEIPELVRELRREGALEKVKNR